MKKKCPSENSCKTSAYLIDNSIPKLQKKSLDAATFTGGVGKQFFRATENFGHSGWLELVSTSLTREVISLAGKGFDGYSAETRFMIDRSFFSNPESCKKHMLWVHGMWDHYKNLSGNLLSLHKTMPTFGRFRITLNDKVAFDDSIFFWNYRRWKFWPCVNLQVEESFFRQGLNILRIENLTPPFLQNIPEYYQPFSDEPDGVPRETIPEEIKCNTLFHLSAIDIATQTFDDMAILNCPDIVNIGEQFRIEIFATRRHKIELNVSEGIEAARCTAIKPGRNILLFKAKKAGVDFSIQFHSRSTDANSVARIKHVVNVPSVNFLLGHIIGGHLSAFPVNHDYKHLVELFRDTQQGNLLVWLAEPRKAADYITAEMLPLTEIKKCGLKVALRYYGSGYGSKFPAKRPYHEEVQKIADKLGSSFIGLAAHEFGSYSRAILDETGRRDLAVEKFTAKAADMFAEFEALVPRCKKWITDPSLYSDIYCRVGSDMPGLELFPLHCTLNISACRGAMKAFRKKAWAAINAFECQAYGGLDMFEPMAYLDPRHAEKRLNLWRLSQFYLYLAGSRMIYSESGAFEQVVGRQLELDHPDIVKFRLVQKNLFEFSKVHPLRGQPITEFAFIKSDKDFFGGIYIPSSPGKVIPSDSSWEKLRAAIPQLRWRDNRPIAQAGKTLRNDFSDAPFGEVDVIPMEAAKNILGQYRAAVLVGQHDISEMQAKNLKKFAKGGGQLIVTLADFIRDDGTITNPEILKELCGVISASQVQGSFLWEIKVCNSDFNRDIGKIHIPCLLGRGAYDGLVKGNLKLTDSAETIICDAFTKEPFLIRKRIRNGAVWLINAAQHHANSDYLNLVNRIIDTVFRWAQGPLRLIDGKNINYFVYEHDRHADVFRQVFILNNDWYSPQKAHPAKFCFHGLAFRVNVNRNYPSQFFIWRDVVILPDSPVFRINSISHTAANDVEIECEGACEAAVCIHSQKRVTCVQLIDVNGDATELRLTRNVKSAVTFNIKSRGLYRLRIIFR